MSLRKLLLPLAVLLTAAALAACGDDGAGGRATLAPGADVFSCAAAPLAEAPNASAFPLQLDADDGEALTLDAPPAAVASLSAGHTEVLYAIGAGDQVAAVDNTSDCPAVADGLPHVDAFNPSVEAIVALNPDLVLLFFDPSGLASDLRQLGVPVLFLETPDSVDSALGQITLLGRATGHESQAAALVRSMQERIDAVERSVSGARAPSVYHEIDNTYYTAGPGSFVGDLYDKLHARNIAASTGEAFPQLSAEAIIAASPDVIILADEDAGESPDTVAARPGWSQVNAVVNQRVYSLDPDIASRPGPRLVVALETLARFLYPERFP
ncbi:MAG: ABC transporter substrate-binding protein [Dehalococcoidia bacterium]|nr:ABC transporter substrate-binding protein [Dehalococcoidia bacterium]